MIEVGVECQLFTSLWVGLSQESKGVFVPPVIAPIHSYFRMLEKT